MDWVFYLYQITKWYGFCWNISGLIAYYDKKTDGKFGKLADLARKFIGETKPFYFLFMGGFYVSLSLMDKFHWYTTLLFLWDVLMYYIIKDLGDDSWKRRIEKLSEKVEISEGKLVVVPTN